MHSNKIIEILQNIHIDDQMVVGRSISILARFAQEKLPVSSGFVITTLGFHALIDYTDLKTYYENAKKSEKSNFSDLKKAFDVVQLPGILTSDLSKSYAKISGFSDAYVNMRALILDKSGREISHRSFVLFDIRGEDSIKQNLIRIYKNVIFDNEQIIDKFFHGELQIVVLVQKAQQSEASGIMFTSDVITKDVNKLAIEAVYGLESIVDFDAVVPDQYIYDKIKDEIVEKHITNQEYMAVRQVGDAGTSVQKVKISAAWQKRQKLDDKHILTLAKTGKIIEDGMGEPQQVIWLYESGKIWINFIESSQKITLSLDQENNVNPTIQQMIDEQVVHAAEDASDHRDQKKESGTDVTVHIPENVRTNKNVLVDLVLSDNEDSNEQPQVEDIVETNKIVDQKSETKHTIKFDKNGEMHTMNETDTNQSKEPLLRGDYFAGDVAQGEVIFDPNLAKSTDILVLKGDEDLPASIQVAGFVIEDESELLAERLHEYFAVPVITGVSLARKILKQGEKITIHGTDGAIFETVPFSQQVGEIEMNFVTRTPEHEENTHVTIPVMEDESFSIHTEIPVLPEVAIPAKEVVITDQSQKHTDYLKKSRFEDDDLNVFAIDHTAVDHTEEKTEEILDNRHSNETNLDNEKLSKLLHLVQEDTDIVEVRQDEQIDEEVGGISTQDQFNVWGQSLEKMMQASTAISSTTAADAIEKIIDDTTELTQNSKEISFDNEEVYIAKSVQEDHKLDRQIDFSGAFLPTATKVYVHLIDEKLPEALENFDGIVFSSSYDQDIYLEILEDVLARSQDKPVLAVCPPYEKEALMRFIEEIHNLRNKKFKNLSLVLPDYRNKSEIAEVKKMLSSIGLRRSSTFLIFANVSRTINVFRINEIDKSIVDGLYVDLFRLKMNMLGVEKMTASTKYVDGMKNMVSYIHDHVAVDGNALLNITGFGNYKKVLNHVLQFGFNTIACSLEDILEVKKQVSSIEKKHIINPTNLLRSKKIGRRY